MTDIEKRAWSALDNCSMRLGSSGLRFRRDVGGQIDNDPEFKLTAGQALYMWQLIHLYRRQVKDPEILGYAAHADARGELPPIYGPEDHRETSRATKAAQPKLTAEQRRAEAHTIATKQIAGQPCKCGLCFANFYVEACRSLRVSSQGLKSSGLCSTSSTELGNNIFDIPRG